MILEIDAGNTKVKWRLRASSVREQELLGAVQLSIESVLGEEDVVALGVQIARRLNDLPVGQLQRILVANVRGEAYENRLTILAKELWGITPEFARSGWVCGGVTNGYQEPFKLGVDRWLAMVAAYNSVRTSCCIMDCGTTITLDLLDGTGKHLGGYIVPGLNMMKSVLAHKSPILGVGNLAWGLGLGINTGEAIHHGLLVMLLGMIQQVSDFAEQRAIEPVWFISGGDGDILLSHLPEGTRLEPSLVLDGLAFVFPASATDVRKFAE